MAILAEIEPPSNGETGKTNNVSVSTKIKNHLNSVLNTFLAFARSFWKQAKGKLCLGATKEVSSTEEIVTQSRVQLARNFLIHLNYTMFSAKYLPHIAIGLFAFIVAVSNINDRVVAQDIYNQLIYVSPTDQADIADSVDRYTNMINTDSDVVKKSTVNSGDSDGFASKNNPVMTEITSRVTIDPEQDNTSKTIKYVVNSGDTLSGIGMRFNVKLLTLQYLNKISNADGLKPGMKLEIPPQGYEVSASAITKWQNQNKAKLAVANSRNTVTRNSSSSRSNGEAGGYVGEIDGVKYVRKAKSNELQCYTYVTSQGYGVGGHLLAKWIPTNSNTPKVGGLVVTYESWAGHVAVVIGVNGDGSFNLRESNYTHGWITERTMSVKSSKIKGFVN